MRTIVDLSDVFERRRQFATYWMNKANDLHRSAAALWASMDANASPALTRGGCIEPVFRMLCGMSLELLYKALIVQSGGKPPSTHELIHLANLAKIKPSKQEEALLKILTEYIKWEGRYPVPQERKSWAALDDLVRKHLFREVYRRGSFAIIRDNDALSWDGYEELWQRAYSKYRW